MKKYSPLRRTGFKRKPLSRKYGLKRKPFKAKRDTRLAAWSRAIKRRDKVCQWPLCPFRGQGVTLDAHHKAPRSLRPDLKFELTNGILLCRYHHEHAHHEGKAAAIRLGILITETYELARRELAA